MKLLQKIPKRMLLLDAVGASVSAVLIGFVLVRFRDFIGLEREQLFGLAAVPVVFVVYDLLAYYRCKNVGVCLRLIAWANLFYCALSLLLLLVNVNTLTILGWAYFIGEIILVLFIARYELILSRTVLK